MVKINVFIPAAGKGTRLLHLTHDKPKALVEVKGKPMLQHVLEKIKLLEPAEIIVNVHHHADQINSFLKEYNDKILISDESDKLLDTGGGLKQALSILKTKNNYPTLVYNVDINTNLELKQVAGYAEIFHSDYDNSLAVMVASNRESSRYLLFDKEMTLMGWENVKTGDKIIKRKGTISHKLAFSGIQLVNPKMLDVITEDTVFPLIPEYLRLIDNYKIMGMMTNAYIIDLGKLDSLNYFLNNN